MSNKTVRNLGSIYTPPDFAKFLTAWAIQSPNHKVLDVGIGEGAFVFAAYNRLRELGANANDAQSQLYGTEIDHSAYSKFLKQAKDKDLDTNFPNLHQKNFFDIDFPLVDAVVGNPPYVRRTYINDIERIRQSVIKKNQSISELDLPRLTDLYIYFLLRALTVLKPKGRLAVITADSWLNVGYGRGFKKYLQQQFEIESLISIDRRVFDDAQVKPVLTLATKKESVNPNRSIYFIRVKNGLSISSLYQSVDNPNLEVTDIACFDVKGNTLYPDTPWAIYFKAPEIYEKLATHDLMKSISDLAETRIGLQTLAKDFFVLTLEQARKNQIEPEYLEPLAQSSRYFNDPTIEPDTQPIFYIFYCSKNKKDLYGTYALEYILRGERTEVTVRGKNMTVDGYHNKERIKRSSRKLWYDLKTSLERRGRASILIPRLVYHSFTVVWNRAKFVPGELFIEFLPYSNTDIEVYLAILNSSVTEMMLRIYAQVYGGGTYNINPGQIKRVPIINVDLLTVEQKKELKQTYLQYLTDRDHDRSAIDVVIYKILEFDTTMQCKLKDVLKDLLLIATSSKQVASPSP